MLPDIPVDHVKSHISIIDNILRIRHKLPSGPSQPVDGFLWLQFCRVVPDTVADIPDKCFCVLRSHLYADITQDFHDRRIIRTDLTANCDSLPLPVFKIRQFYALLPGIDVLIDRHWHDRVGAGAYSRRLSGSVPLLHSDAQVICPPGSALQFHRLPGKGGDIPLILHPLAVVHEKGFQEIIELIGTLHLSGPVLHRFYVLCPIYHVLDLKDMVKQLIREWFCRRQFLHAIQ